MNQQANEAKIRSNLIEALEGENARIGFNEAVKDLPLKALNMKTANVPYTLWDMVEHMRVTQWDIVQYIKYPEYVSPEWPQEYWPRMSELATLDKWEHSVSSFNKDLDELEALINDRNIDIFAPVVYMNDDSIFQKALLAINHTAYHLGEFILCRQALGFWKSLLSGRMRE